MGITRPLFAFLAALSLTGGHLGARVIRSEDRVAGPSLLGNRSAEALLCVDGVVSDSGLDAAKVINQPMHEVNIDLHNVFAIPLADALAFCGAINELTLLHRQAFETLEAQGVSHREAVAVLNDPKVKNSLEHLAEQTKALHECEIQIQKKAETLALDSLPKDGGPTDPSSGDGSILQDGPNLTDTVHANLQKQDLQNLLEKRKALAAEVTQTAEDVQRASTNPGLHQWMERFKEGMDWAAHQYDQFLEQCSDVKNWVSDNKCVMLGAGLVATGLVVATLPLSGPSLVMAGAGAVAVTSAIETAGLVTTGMGLTGAGATIMMNTKHEGGGNGSKQEPASQPGPQKPQTKPGQVGEYGKLKKESIGDGLDAHHMPHDQYMKAHGVKKDDGIAMLLDEATHRRRIHSRGFQTLDPTLAPRNALLKSIQRVKNKMIEAKAYTPEIREGLREVVRKNMDRFPHLFKK